MNKKQFALWFQREKLFDMNEKLYLEKLVIERTINCILYWGKFTVLIRFLNFFHELFLVDEVKRWMKC